MPWRTKTLIQFRSSPEAEVEHSENDYGFEHVGEALLQDDGNFDLFGGVSESEDFVATGISSSSEFLQGAVTAMADPVKVRSKRRVDALNLGAAQVPRGPVLDSDNFSQMLQDAFIRNAEPMSVVMPWEKGVAKAIFSKGPNILKVQKQQLKSWVQATDNLSEDAVASGPTMVEAPSATLSGALFERHYRL